MDDYRVELFISKHSKLTELENCFNSNERKLWIKQREEEILSEFYNREVTLKE